LAGKITKSDRPPGFAASSGGAVASVCARQWRSERVRAPWTPLRTGSASPRRPAGRTAAGATRKDSC